MRRSFALALSLGGIAVIGVPAAMAKNNLDRTKLVVGKTSTAAQRDRLWSCQSSFSSNAPGAFKDGPWLNGDGTWDMTKKVTVDGSTKWPNANLSVSVSGSDRVITGNALPINGATGTYPVASTDDAYNYDRNPNTVSAQTISVKIPAQPKVNATPQCVGGEVGISLDGPAIFSSIDAGGRDAQAYEIQDACSGHPERTGSYHYHGLSTCSDKTKQFGWALDGFAIWGSVDPATGVEWTNDELDECHGVTSEITLDGKKVTTYHYVANDQYPYTVGCYRGTPSARSASNSGASSSATGGSTSCPTPQGQAGQPPAGQGQPPAGQQGRPPQGARPPQGQPPAAQGQGQGPAQGQCPPAQGAGASTSASATTTTPVAKSSTPKQTTQKKTTAKRRTSATRAR